MTAPLDHVEHALGIASLVTIGVIGGSLHLAVKVIIDSIAPQWRRIVRLASGHVEESSALITSVERGFVAARGRE